MYFVSCQEAQISSDTPAGRSTVTDGVFWGHSGDVGYYRISCVLHLNGIQLPYIFSPVSLSLITAAKHGIRNRCRLILIVSILCLMSLFACGTQKGNVAFLCLISVLLRAAC